MRKRDASILIMLKTTCKRHIITRAISAEDLTGDKNFQNINVLFCFIPTDNKMKSIFILLRLIIAAVKEHSSLGVF